MKETDSSVMEEVGEVELQVSFLVGIFLFISFLLLILYSSLYDEACMTD